MPAPTTILGEREMNGNKFQGWNGGGEMDEKGEERGAVSNNNSRRHHNQGWRCTLLMTDPPRPRVDTSEGGKAWDKA